MENTNKKLILIFLVFFLNACSFIERHAYFTPVSGALDLSGPKGSGCAYRTQASGLPNIAIINLSGNKAWVKTNESFEPYLFGPLIVPPVVPVFPLTWGVDALVDSDLSLKVEHEEAFNLLEHDVKIVVEYYDLSKNTFNPIEIERSLWKSMVRFPVKGNSIKSFDFIVGDQVKLGFKQTARWNYSWFSINC